MCFLCYSAFMSNKELDAPPSAPIDWVCKSGDRTVTVRAQTWIQARSKALQAFAAESLYPDIYELNVRPSDS